MKEAAQKFLTQIAETLDYDPETLDLIAELRTGGPTVQPGPASEDQIEKVASLRKGEAFPSGWYDTIGSKHIEYRIVQLQSKGDVEIPRTLYSFQHHPFPGNCRIGINRWVRKIDNAEWPEELLNAGLRFRVALAKKHGCSLLSVTSGASAKSGSAVGAHAERFNAFEKVFEGTGRAIFVLNVNDYLNGS